MMGRGCVMRRVIWRLRMVRRRVVGRRGAKGSRASRLQSELFTNGNRRSFDFLFEFFHFILEVLFGSLILRTL
jgi:hypothetical protein